MEMKPFETVEDLVNYATTRLYDTTKWMIEDRSNWECIDKVAEAAWRTTEPEWVSYSDPKHAEYNIARKAWYDLQPEQILVTVWSLSEHSTSRHNQYVRLSNELGELLSGIWKMGPAWRGSSSLKRVGNLTIAGMLKRLGMKGLDKQIAAARVSAKLEQEKNGRNYGRRNVRKMAIELLEEMHRHPEIVWPMDVVDMTQVIDE